MNSEIEIKPNIMGVLQSLRLCLTTCLYGLVKQASKDGKNFPDNIRAYW